MKMFVHAFVGSFYDVIALAPVVKSLRSSGAMVLITTTNQKPHRLYDVAYELGLYIDGKFEGPNGVDHNSYASALGVSLTAYYSKMCMFLPHAVLIVGNTATARGVAIGAAVNDIPVIQLDAGYRIVDKSSQHDRMAVEIRKYVELHFAPTSHCCTNLINEGVSISDIRTAGSTTLATLKESLEEDKSRVLSVDTLDQRRLDLLLQDPYHRVVLVAFDAPKDPEKLRVRAQAILEAVSHHEGAVAVFLAHRELVPFLEKSLGETERCLVMESLGYKDTIESISSAECLISDTHYFVVEAAAMGIPVIVSAARTPLAGLVTAKQARLAQSAHSLGVWIHRILDTQWRPVLRTPLAILKTPHGDESTATMVAMAIRKFIRSGLKI